MKVTPLLHAEIHGSGPTVVLLHGFLASSKYWKKVTELVSDNYQVVTLDLLGFGNSPKPRHNKYDYESHLASIEKTLNHLNIDKPFMLVGHSMGALLALRYANTHPEHVSKLILTNMPVMLGKKEVKNEIFKSNLVFRLGLSPGSHRIMWTSLKVLYTLRILPEKAINSLTTNRDYVFSHSALSRLRSFQRVIMHAKTDVDLAAIKVKTIVLSGVDDRKVYIENLMHNMALSPSVALHNFKVDHHIPLRMPELLAEKIRS